MSRMIQGESKEQRENICAVNLHRISTARGGCDFGSGLQKSSREQGNQRLGSQRPGQAEVLSESWVIPLGGLESQDLGLCQEKNDISGQNGVISLESSRLVLGYLSWASIFPKSHQYLRCLLSQPTCTHPQKPGQIPKHLQEIRNIY